MENISHVSAKITSAVKGIVPQTSVEQTLVQTPIECSSSKQLEQLSQAIEVAEAMQMQFSKAANAIQKLLES